MAEPFVLLPRTLCDERGPGASAGNRAEAIPGACLAKVPDAGHFAQIEDPDTPRRSLA